MDTSKFIKYLIILPLAIIILSSCNRRSPREIISMNGNWTFSTDSTGRGIEESWQEKGIPEGTGIQVNVPHAWNAMPGLNKYWGKAWYEKEILLPAEWKNKSVKLQFDAVYHDASIWINGKFAGSHNGSGYNRFSVIADSLIHPGTQNRIMVLVDNSSSTNNLPYKKSYDWPNDGGITRKVSFIKTEKGSIEYIHVNGIPDEIRDGEGTAEVLILLDGTDLNTSEAIFEAELKEYNQLTDNRIWKGKLEGIFTGKQFRTKLNFQNIRSWHFDKPDLYKLSIRLKIEGELKDETEATFGFRTIDLSPTNFILNGEQLKLGGIEWMPGSSLKFGMAEPESELSKNLEMMKKVNAVYTRFHWEQDEYVLDWCDRNGILIQEEIPAWGWNTKFNDSLYKIARFQLKEIIEAHYNHPSLIAWGIGNELSAHDSVNIRYLSALYEYTRSLDSSRLVNYVSNQLMAPIKGKSKTLPDASSIGSILMFNEYYSTWYNQNTDSISPALDRIQSYYPNRALVISEFGICEPVFKGGDPRRIKEMKQQFEIFGHKPYVAGAIYFCLNDYRTQLGEDLTYSYPQRVHGIADINLNPKPSYNELRSILSPLEIVSIEKKDGKVKFSLRCKTELPSYTVKNYTISTSREKLLTGELKPGEKRQFEIEYKGNSDTLRISRPTGFQVICLAL